MSIKFLDSKRALDAAQDSIALIGLTDREVDEGNGDNYFEESYTLAALDCVVQICINNFDHVVDVFLLTNSPEGTYMYELKTVYAFLGLGTRQDVKNSCTSAKMLPEVLERVLAQLRLVVTHISDSGDFALWRASPAY
jgi:hypothetical protein